MYGELQKLEIIFQLPKKKKSLSCLSQCSIVTLKSYQGSRLISTQCVLFAPCLSEFIYYVLLKYHLSTKIVPLWQGLMI